MSPIVNGSQSASPLFSYPTISVPIADFNLLQKGGFLELSSLGEVTLSPLGCRLLSECSSILGKQLLTYKYTL